MSGITNKIKSRFLALLGEKTNWWNGSRALIPVYLQVADDALRWVAGSYLPLWPMLSFLRIYQLHFYYLPSPYRQCACALGPARIWFSSYLSFAWLSSDLAPSSPTFRIPLCVCIFAASLDFSLYGNRNKAGKWSILGSTSRGWEHPEREGEGLFLYKEMATLSFKLCWLPTRHPLPFLTPSFLLHRTWLLAGPQDIIEC